MNPIQPSSSPRANRVHPIAPNEANEAQAQLPPIPENPGNLPLSVSPRGQTRAVQLGVMNLPPELQCAIFKNIHTLEDCERVFQGLKEGVKIIESSKLDPASKEAEIKKLKCLLTLLLKECSIKKLDFQDIKTIERLTGMAIFLGERIKFEQLAKFVTYASLIGLFETLIEAYENKTTLYIERRTTALPDMSSLAGCKTIYIRPNSEGSYPIQLRSLRGIEICSNLTELCLRGCCRSLININPLAALTNLTFLRLDNCKALTDIKPLAALTKLTALIVNNSGRYTNISSLAALSNLTHLKLDDCNALTDIGNLAGLTNLTHLILNNCNVLTDISPLAGLKQLTELGLNNCNVLTDISNLAGLANLTHLILNNCNVLTDIRPLAGLTQLNTLALNGCHGLTDIRSLAGLTQLTELGLANCHALTDISSLTGLTQLRTLYLSGSTNIQTLEALEENLPNLTIIRE